MVTVQKTDHKKKERHLYNPPQKFDLIEVPEMWFIKVDGQGDPNTSSAFQDAIKALFGVAYTAKFVCKLD